jgi:hypothetical protein
MQAERHRISGYVTPFRHSPKKQLPVLLKIFNNLGTGVIQAPRELTEPVRAPGDQSHPEASGGEAMSDCRTEAGPGPDQQQVSAVD